MNEVRCTCKCTCNQNPNEYEGKSYFYFPYRRQWLGAEGKFEDLHNVHRALMLPDYAVRNQTSTITLPVRAVATLDYMLTQGSTHILQPVGSDYVLSLRDGKWRVYCLHPEVQEIVKNRTFNTWVDAFAFVAVSILHEQNYERYRERIGEVLKELDILDHEMSPGSLDLKLTLQERFENHMPSAKTGF